VVITHNRRDELLVTLAHLAALPGEPRVIVVDNASSDDTPSAVVDAFPSVRVMQSAHNLGGGARNIGVEAATTPYVAFADDDSWWDDDALPRAVEIFEASPATAAIAARVVVHPDERDDPTCRVMASSPLRRSDVPFPLVLGFLACASLVRRDLFLEVGGFDGRFVVGGEEQRVAYDLRERGYDIVYAHDVVAHHAPSPVRDVTRRRRRELRNDLWTAWLRRRLLRALSVTARIAMRAVHDPTARGALSDAARGARWVWRERRPLSRAVEREAAMVDAASR
jgi:GT2 family glycosyltransferase